LDIEAFFLIKNFKKILMAIIIPISPLFKLKIQLENVPFEISRKVLVPESISMHELHLIIQITMGWENSHLYQFSDKKGLDRTIEASDSEFDEDFLNSLPDRVNRIDAEVARLKEEFYENLEGKPFFYWYNFGDDWWHKISFQKVTKKDLEVYQNLPVCLEAKGACPPEDVGGPWDFYNFFMTVNEPKSKEGKEFREWLGMKKGEKWDFETVDLEEINENLKEIFSNEDE
jgi:hypothetical protein